VHSQTTTINSNNQSTKFCFGKWRTWSQYQEKRLRVFSGPIMLESVMNSSERSIFGNVMRNNNNNNIIVCNKSSVQEKIRGAFATI